MNDALHAAASAMSTRIRALDVGAQNLVNAMTPGYQKRILTNHSFATALDLELDRDAAMVHTEQSIAFKPGRFVKVEQPLSAAIDGPGLFVVQTPEGLAYTRNGDFMLGRDGTLQTRAGYPVMGANGPIQAARDQGPARFGREGAILQGNEVIGTVRVVELADRGQLEPISETLFRAPEDAAIAPADTSRVLGEYVELPAESSLTGMVAMIAANHQYDSAQRLMSTVNRSYQQLNRGQQN